MNPNPEISTGPSTNSAPRGFIPTAIVVGLGAAGVFLCYRLALPFLTPLALAFVLAVLFAPFQRWIESHIVTPSLAAFAAVFAIAGLAFAFLSVLLTQLVREAATGAELVRAMIEGGLLQKLLAAHPKIATALQTVFDRINAPALAADAASWLTSVSTSFLRGSIVQIVGALLMLFLLFYFLRDRREILAAVRSFLPFTEPEITLLFQRAVDTIHATVYGVVVTGLLIGLIGGGIFAAVGLPAPLLWGLVMAVFAILPVLGTSMVWVPAVLLLVLDGDWGRAVIVTIAFSLLAAADVIAYPFLVGNRMKLHTAVMFIAVVGGLVVFGAVGFILGPLVVALTVVLKEIIWARLANAPSPAN